MNVPPPWEIAKRYVNHGNEIHVHIDNAFLCEIKKPYIEKINELEAQIEKMKCCGNCKIEVKDEEYPCCECDGKNKWELDA